MADKKASTPTSVSELFKTKFYPVDIYAKKIYLFPESTEKRLFRKWHQKLKGYVGIKGKDLQEYSKLYNSFEFVIRPA